jgi:uncharacterized protein (TIGR00369 family)
MLSDPSDLIRLLDDLGKTRLPGLLGIEVLELGPGRSRLRLEVSESHLAPNGYLHAATVVALADTAAGYGTMASLPKGATGFTTVEMKANFLGTTLDGGIAAEARLLHGGRTTQIWDATVVAEQTGKSLTLFRCTQLMIYPA